MGILSPIGTGRLCENRFVVRMCKKLWVFVVLLLVFLKVREADGQAPLQGQVDSGEPRIFLKRTEDIIPYPRMGRTAGNLQTILMSFDTSSLRLPSGEANDHFRIPDPDAVTTTPDNDDDKKNKFSYMPNAPGSEYMLPYPRPGRSSIFDRDNSNLDNSDFSDNLIPQLRLKRSLDKTEDHKIKPMTPSIELGYSEFITPYPRIGKKSSESITPHMRFGRQSDDGTLLPYLRFGRSDDDEVNEYESITPYPRMGRNSESEESIETLIPYMRFGRSDDGAEESYDTITPYPRMGRSSEESMIPLLRFGRDTDGMYITPYPRMGKRSDALLPYMRFGRQMSKKSGESVLPHLRFGRDEEEYITPYPRMGRQSGDSMIPLMRFGRRTAFMTPYPRLGKKSEDSPLLPCLRFGQNTEHLTHYPRVGKKNDETLIPYLRFGRGSIYCSGNSAKFIHRNEIRSRLFRTHEQAPDVNKPSRPERSETVDVADEPETNTTETDAEEQETLIPYPRFGRTSEAEQPIPNTKSETARRSLLSTQKLVKLAQKHTSKEVPTDDFSYIVPYPRPGRTVFLNSQKKPSVRRFDYDQRKPQKVQASSKDPNPVASDYMLPYLRPGRSS